MARAKQKATTNDISKLAVIYARYSSHNQTEQSIEGQLAAGHRYADLKGYTVVHEYIDRAMTGRNDNRDDFQKMLSDTSKKQFGVIIVWKVDRFGRNREEITFNKYRCKKNGVRVEYVAENLPDSPEGVILESVLEGMAEYYSLQLSQNVQRGLLESAKKHQVIGGNVPLGLMMDEHKKYAPDPKTAPTVKLIFDMYAEGSTTSEIINHLNSIGMRTKAGKPFTKSSLTTVLKNEKYIGVYKYKDIIRDEDVIPPIVDKEIFYKVQELLKVNRRMPSHKWSYSDYILTDKLFCGKCGTAMVGESGFGKMGVKYSYYMCAKRRKDKTCDKKPVRQEWIEEIVLQHVQGILQNDELLEFIAENTWQYYLAQDESMEKLKGLQAELDKVEKSAANLMKAIEAGIFNDMTKARMDELDDQRAVIKKAMAEIEIEKGFKLTKDHILYFLEQFKKLDYKDRDCQRRLIDVFVNSIFVYDDKLRIAFNFGGSDGTITLNEVDKADRGEGFVCCASCPAITITYEPNIMWFSHVFVVDMKIPEKQ